MNLINLSVTQWVSAPPQKAFTRWMDAKAPGSFWHGGHRVILNPVVGGLFYVAVKHEGKIWPHFGRFLKLQRPRRAEYTWMSPATKGVESVVSVTFKARKKGTLITLRHSGVPDDKMGRQHKDGWTWILSMFAKQFAAKPSSKG